jgi:HAE1 family hydrophobic/amphiphilic exporter-1
VLLGHVVTRRTVTFGVLALFGLGIFAVDRTLPAGFIPNEDQGQIYAIIQTPPGTTLERTNEVSRHLQEIARGVEGVESVSSLAGYEILTEGRGSNAGTCLINLRPWSERTHSVREIIEELEEQTKDIGAVVEFFEPPSVPGYGAADGFALRLLDLKRRPTTRSSTGQPGVHGGALPAPRAHRASSRSSRPTTRSTSSSSTTSSRCRRASRSGRPLDNLDILVGSTYEQGFIRFGRFFKVYVQVAARVPPHALGHPRPLRQERPARWCPIRTS